MNLEEYIAKRKQEDKLNEFDLSARAEHTRICVNYIFEFFNDYVDTVQYSEKPTDPNNKIDKYRHMVRQYDPDIQEWLVSLYSKSEKQVHKILIHQINDEFFFLFCTDSDFRSLSYKVYANVVHKYPVFEDQAEMIFRFIKDYHKVNSTLQENETSLTENEAIDHWINDTYDKYGVNLPHFCWEYIQEYLKHPSEWPKETKEKNVDIYNSYLEDMRTKGRSIWTEEFLWHYNYRKTLDPFNISGLYRRMPKKPFTRGRKEQFQYLILYYATDWFDDDSFWEEYSSKFN